jgi:hypothetical protein
MMEGQLDWIHLCRNCFLKQVIEGKIERTKRRGRRCKQLVEDLQEMKRYWNLKKKAVDCTHWRTHFGRVYACLIRQTT